MNSRTESIIHSSGRNGFFQTISLFIQMILLKLGLRKSVKLKGLPKLAIRKGSSDLPVFRQIFMDGEYDIYLPTKDPKVIVDLGANIGFFALLMNQRFPNAKIYSVEPLPSNFEQAKLNTANFEQIKCLNKAIWGKNGSIEMEIGQYGEWGAQAKEAGSDQSGKKSVPIEAITMSTLMEREGIDQMDIVKIDIEGAEENLFGEHADLGWLQKVHILIIELHDFMEPQSSNPFFRAIPKMEKFNFFLNGENLVFINQNFKQV